ncbi:methylthioribulose 1-phosphate dehydratase [Spirulina major]|nr:methylthioribulose 1-phosphate dehydratase [Spirulina major]
MPSQSHQLCTLIAQLHAQGKSPATSTNYSYRNEAGDVVISRSGVDKSQFRVEDFLQVDLDGQPLPEFAAVKPSAETLIHCFLYREFPDVMTVLHTHSVAATILSDLFLSPQQISFTGYEVIKGIEGHQTHDTAIQLPIFANQQDMVTLCDRFTARRAELNNYGLLIAKHGLYAWGQDFATAKRHLEVWEFLLECELELLKIKS